MITTLITVICPGHYISQENANSKYSRPTFVENMQRIIFIAIDVTPTENEIPNLLRV